MAQLVSMQGFRRRMQEDYPFELVGAKPIPLSEIDLTESPTRARLPRLARPQQGFPLDSVTQRVRVPDNLQDLNVPMLSLGALGLDDFTQVRWGPEMV